jgi:hypothetical protein
MSPPAAKTTRLPSATWRQPDQRIPHHVTGVLDQAFPPDEGRASPPRRRGPTSYDTLGSSPLVARSFSPARLNAVGAGLHGRARLHYVEREAPGHKAPAQPHHPGTEHPPPGWAPACPRTAQPPATTPVPWATGTSRSNTRPGQRHRTKINNEIPRGRLTQVLLRWCRHPHEVLLHRGLLQNRHGVATGAAAHGGPSRLFLALPEPRLVALPDDPGTCRIGQRPPRALSRRGMTGCRCIPGFGRWLRRASTGEVSVKAAPIP